MLVVAPRLPLLADVPPAVWPWAAAGLVVLIVAGFAAALVTQMTVVELSRLRPARRKEATHRLRANALRLIGCQVLVAGLVVLLIAGLRALPGWVLTREILPVSADALAAAATVVGLVLEVILWPILGLAFLLAPIVVVAECGVGAALRQWYGL